MFKIGDFSKLSQVSVKTLRYYDEIGLLKPAQIDRFSGYCYYSSDQLPYLNRILALKDLGLSLEQISQLLDGILPPEQLRGMLRLKQAELQLQVDSWQAQLSRVEARLRQIEQEGKMPDYEVVLKKIEPQSAATLRQVLPHYRDIGRLFEEILAFIGRNGGRPAGPPMAIYYDAEYRETDADVEAAIPIVGPLLTPNTVAIRELPGGEMAGVVHKGSYENLGMAYGALMNWIQTNGYRIAGPNREVYLSGPDTGADPETYVTEIQFPVEKA